MVPSLTDMTQIQVFSKFPEPMWISLCSPWAAVPQGAGEEGKVCAASGGSWKDPSPAFTQSKQMYGHNLEFAEVWGHLRQGLNLQLEPACPPILGLLLPEAEGLWKDSRATVVIPGIPLIQAEWGAKGQSLGERGNADGQGEVPGSACQPGAQSLEWCNGTTELLFTGGDSHNRNLAEAHWL